jgi:biotin carboxylase
VGHRYSHEYVNCTTVDKQQVAWIAEQRGIDGICTFSSDVAMPTVGYVCDQLGLSGPTEVVAETMSSKHLFRAFLQENGLPCPRFAAGRDFEATWPDIRDLEYPVVLKPTDSSGSRGVVRLNEPAAELARALFDAARRYSRSSTVCVEEFIPGIEVGGDAVLYDGKIACIAITEKHRRGFLVTGHSLPGNITPEQKSMVVEQLERCCSALGYRVGPLNFDVMVSDHSATIIEMSARNGGNGIPDIIQRASGVDLERVTIELALGHGLRGVENSHRGQAGSLVFGSPKPGLLEALASPEEVRRAEPRVFDMHVSKAIGEPVEAFTHGGAALGVVLFDISSPADYHRIVTSVEKALALQIREDSSA